MYRLKLKRDDHTKLNILSCNVNLGGSDVIDTASKPLHDVTKSLPAILLPKSQQVEQLSKTNHSINKLPCVTPAMKVGLRHGLQPGLRHGEACPAELATLPDGENLTEPSVINVCSNENQHHVELKDKEQTQKQHSEEHDDKEHDDKEHDDKEHNDKENNDKEDIRKLKRKQQKQQKKKIQHDIKKEPPELAIKTCDMASDALDKGDNKRALLLFREAYLLLPEPRHTWEQACFILSSMSDIYMDMREWNLALNAARKAEKCPDIHDQPRSKLYVSRQIGIASFELGDLKTAREELAKVIIACGNELFEDDDPKYYNYVSKRIITYQNEEQINNKQGFINI